MLTWNASRASWTCARFLFVSRMLLYLYFSISLSVYFSVSPLFSVSFWSFVALVGVLVMPSDFSRSSLFWRGAKAPARDV